MSEDYYTEDPESLPYDINVAVYAQHVPWILAVTVVRWRRFRRWIGRPVPQTSASRWHELIEWHSHADMPAQALSRWAPIIEQLEDLGFEIVGRIRSDTIGQKTEATIFLLDRSGQTVATIIWMQIGDIQQTQLTMTSYLHDGTEIATLALPPVQQIMLESIAPAYMQTHAMSHRTSPQKLFHTHRQRTQVSEAVVFTPETFLPFYQKQRKTFFEHSCQKGTLRKLHPREVRSLSADTISRRSSSG